MGYDLHVTRRKDWSQSGEDITAEEWLAYVKQDRELSLSPEDGPYFVRWKSQSKHNGPWLDWCKGNVYSKNPDEALVDKMIAIARCLSAQVQGDDGEIYHSGFEPPVCPQPSTFDRLRNWLRALRSAPPLNPIEPPFRVGDRVFDVFHKEATVVEIDLNSNHRLGKVKVRYDNGREVTLMLAASGLNPIQGAKKQTTETQ